MNKLLSPPANPRILFLVGPKAERLAEYVLTGTRLRGWVVNDGRMMTTVNNSKTQFVGMLELFQGVLEIDPSANQCLSKMGA